MSPEDTPAAPIVIHPPIHGEVIEDATAPAPMPLPPLERPVAPLPLVTVQPDTAAAAPAPTERVTTAVKRAFSVDALRGLFLVLMTLGFTLRGSDYPLWMYHRQMPPPDFAVVNVAGISWRDLAYGAFLFTMAAALPLTLSRRIAKGETEVAIIASAIKRYGLLLLFAILIGHSNTYFIGYTQTGRALGIAGFAIMAMIYTRRRDDWDENRFKWLRRAGFALAAVFLLASPALYGQSFSPARTDDIIVGLAAASLMASVLWYFTRENLVARVGALAVVVALYLGSRSEGWLQSWWYSSPFEWALAPSMLGLLTVVIPGTIAGDVVLKWMHSAEAPGLAGWQTWRAALLGLLSVALTPIVVIGAYTRAVAPMTQLIVALLLGGVILTMRPVTSTERLLRSLFVAGAVWLSMGLFMEPFEGGMKKVPETLSYFFTIAGLTTMLLVALAVAIDVLNKRKLLRPLIDVGHNPLLAYVLFTILITAVTEMIVPLRGVLRGSVGESFLRSVLSTVAVVALVSVVSRRRIFWRT